MMSTDRSCRETRCIVENQSLSYGVRIGHYFSCYLMALGFSGLVSALVILSGAVYAAMGDPLLHDSYENIGNEIIVTTAPEPVDEAPTAREYWIPHTIASGQNLSKIFKQLNISSNYLWTMMRADPLAKRLRRIKPGQLLKFHFIDDDFAGLEYVVGPTYSLLASRNGDSFIFLENKKSYDKQTQFASVTINSSLFVAAQNAGISGKTTMEIAELFGWDIDFALDIRKGDRFSVVYQTLHFDGKKIKDGHILAAEFVNKGKAYKAVRYTDPDGNAGYYNPQGVNMYKPFLRTPVDFTRISSHFGHRYHPVLNKMRAHNGVDYAAPRGTRVRASGDGKLIFKGSLRGYGNTVIIEHGAGYRTLYAHLQSYNRKQRMGSRVKQGQTIGYVGSSGLATGPHLHYEFQVNGVHRNPVTIKLPAAKPLNPKYLVDFEQKSKTFLALLTNTSNHLVAMNNPTE